MVERSHLCGTGPHIVILPAFTLCSYRRWLITLKLLITVFGCSIGLPKGLMVNINININSIAVSPIRGDLYRRR